MQSYKLRYLLNVSAIFKVHYSFSLTPFFHSILYSTFYINYNNEVFTFIL